MTNRERVEAFFAGQPVDKVPHCFWIHAPVDKRTGQDAFEAQLRFHNELNNSFIKLLDDHAPKSSVAISYARDWDSFKGYDANAPHHVNNMDLIKRFAEHNAGKELLYFTFFSPWAQMRRLCGNDTYMIAFTKAHSQQFVDAQKRMVECLKREAEDMFAAGIDGMFYATAGGEQHRFEPSLFEEYVGKPDREVLDFLNEGGRNNILHMCGPQLRFSLYRDYKAAAYNWDSHKMNMSLKEGQAFWGKPVFGGVDNQGPVISGTPDDCRAEAKAVMDEMGKDGFMFGAGCTVAMFTPLENVKAMIEVVESY